MKARDLQKAFSAVSPDFRKEAREIAGTKQKHSGRRRIVLKIAAGLTAAAAVFGGLLFAGVWLANNDGVNVQKVNYPVEVVTGAGAAGTSTVTDGTALQGEDSETKVSGTAVSDAVSGGEEGTTTGTAEVIPVQLTQGTASQTTAAAASLTQPAYTTAAAGTTEEPIITTRWVGGTRVMQLDDVRTLAKKGMSLKWADFEPYHGLGSDPNGGGMRIQTYDVGEYTLSVCGWYSVGGAVYDPELDSVVLYVKEPDRSMVIDIRTGDLEQFLIDCQNYYLTTTMPTTTSATTTTTTTLPAPQRPNLQDGSLFRWIDCGEFTGNSPFNLTETLVMPDAPDLEFVFWKGEGVEVRRGDTVVAAVGGMPLWKVYFADINGDGWFDMITDAGMGSGRYWKVVQVYDYHNDRFYHFAAEDSLQWDYALDVREIYSYGTYELCLRRYKVDTFGPDTDCTLGRMALVGDTLTFAPFEIID